MKKQVKNILLKVEMVGNGVVNYDSSSQSYFWNENTAKTGQEIITDKNVKFAKKRWYKKEDGKTDYKLIISGGCLRHNIYGDDAQFQSPNIINSDHLLISMIASPAMLTRGYMFAKKELTIKRKSALCITDAEQTNDAMSTIETCNVAGGKLKDDNKADITYFKKESVGNITYEASGNIDMMQLQFVSCDELFDRMSLKPDLFDFYTQVLKTRLPNFNSKLGYYQIANSVVELPEYGFMLNNADTLELTKDLLHKILKTDIRTATAFARVSSIKIKLVEDVFEDLIDDEEGWIEITPKTKDIIDTLDFDTNTFYNEYDFKAAKDLRLDLETKMEEIKAINKIEADKAKDAKSADKAAKKAAKTV